MGWFDQFLDRQPQQEVPGGPGMPPEENWWWDGTTWQPPIPGGTPTPQVPTTPTPTGAPTSPFNPGAPLEGWDPTKWANQDHQSHKYQVGRILAKYPPTVEGLKQALPELQTLYPGAKIVGLGDLDLGLGEDPVDVLRAASQGGTGWQWLTTDEARAPMDLAGLPSNTLMGGGSGGGNYSFGGNYSYGGGGGNYTDRMPMLGGAPTFTPIDPFKGPDSPAPAAPWSPTQVTPGQIKPTGQVGSFSFGGQLPPDYAPPTALDAVKPGPTMAIRPEFTYDPLKSSDPFVLPTGQQALEQDPGYQFRLSQGLKARESSAAQRGLLRTGATLKGLDEFGQEMASQEYGNAYNRAFQTYGLNQGVRQSEQAQQYGQRLGAEQQNAAQRLNEFNTQLASSGQEFQQRATQQGMNEAQRLAAYNALLTKQNQGFGQALSGAQFNADNTNRFADRDLSAQMQNQANLLAANQANNAFNFQAAGWNADQLQQRYLNQMDAAKTGYGYLQAQNFAKNAQDLQGYQIDVSRDLAQQGINLTASQNAFMNGLNGQQQQWMQMFMMNGQSFDQAYKMLLARLQYPY